MKDRRRWINFTNKSVISLLQETNNAKEKNYSDKKKKKKKERADK